MKECGVDIEPEIDCWCGFKSIFHHTSRFSRRDGKITIWYKCRNSHMSSVDVPYKAGFVEKPKKTKKVKKVEKEVLTQ